MHRGGLSNVGVEWEDFILGSLQAQRTGTIMNREQTQTDTDVWHGIANILRSPRRSAVSYYS
jgi:hypothetical protein